MKRKTIWTVLAGAAIGVTAVVVSCGGGGGGGGGSDATTRFEGNVANATAFLAPSAPQSRWAWLSPVGVAWAQVAGVEVCLATDPTNCTQTQADGSFVLNVIGDLLDPCLIFTATGATGFTATVCISGTIPQGSVVRVGSIECSVSQGTCQAEDVDIEEAGEEVSDEVSDEDVPSAPSAPSAPSEPSNDDDGDDSGSSGNSGTGSGEDEPEDD